MPAPRPPGIGGSSLWHRAGFLGLALLCFVPDAAVGSVSGTSADAGHDDWHPNHVALLVGGTTPRSSTGETVFAIGISYERRFSELIGIEGLAEFGIGEAKRTGLFVAGPTVRPFTLLDESRARDLLAPVKLETGPGFEIVEKNGKTSVHFVYGVGFGYDIHVAQFTVTPGLYVDFIGETKTNLTYGINLGWGF